MFKKNVALDQIFSNATSNVLVHWFGRLCYASNSPLIYSDPIFLLARTVDRRVSA